MYTTLHCTHITIGVHYAWLTGCVRAGEAAAAASQCFEFAPGANAADGYIGINTGIPSSADCRARSELSCTHTWGAGAMGAGLRYVRGRWVWRKSLDASCTGTAAGDLRALFVGGGRGRASLHRATAVSEYVSRSPKSARLPHRSYICWERLGRWAGFDFVREREAHLQASGS